MKLSHPILLIMVIWLAGFITVVVSNGTSYPLWYSLAVTFGVVVGAGRDVLIAFLAIVAGSMAPSTRVAIIYALIVTVIVTVYVYKFGLFPGKDVPLKALVGRAVAASTIAILSHLVVGRLKGYKVKPGPD